MTVTKTALKLEDNAHNEHKNIQQTSTKYLHVTSDENIKTTGKQVFCQQSHKYSGKL